MQGPIKNTSTKLYIVDYDVPRRPQSRRRAFYRDLAKLKENMGVFGKMSTMSVVITIDRELAERIYRLASNYGEANIYVGRKMDGKLSITGEELASLKQAERTKFHL